MLRFQNIQIKNNTKPIFGFHHICLLNNGADIFKEQLETIVSSGLYNATTQIFCSIVGAGSDVFELPDKYNVVYQSEDMSSGERKILEYMYVSSNIHIGSYYYIHTKGVSRFNHPFYQNIKDWRLLMEHFLIVHWKNRHNELLNCDVVGINYMTYPLPHFSGNFWWTKSDYISRSPVTFNYKDYLEPEMYICSSRPVKILCVYNTNLGHTHFSTPFPKSLYSHYSGVLNSKTIVLT